MRFSKILTCATLAVVSALVLVQASRYGGNQQYGAGAGGSPYNGAVSHYPASGCHGYNCNSNSNQAARQPYGPYHSYAVRPVVYGGQGLYHYKGYARYPQAPKQHGRRYPRSYGSGAPRKQAAASSYGCQGRYCGGAAAPQRQHYGAPARANYNHQPYHSMRPVRVIALVSPANRYHSNQGYGQQNNHYSSMASRGGNYGAGRGSRQYGAQNNYSHQQRNHHAGAYRQKPASYGSSHSGYNNNGY